MLTATPTKILSTRLSTMLGAITLVALIAATLGAVSASAAAASPTSSSAAAGAESLGTTSAAARDEVPSLTNAAMQPGNGPATQLYVGLGLIGLSLLALVGGLVQLHMYRRSDRDPHPLPTLQPTGSTIA